MAKKFQQTDLYESDIYGNLRQSIDSLIDPLKKASDAAKTFHEEINKTAQNATNSAKGMRDLNEANEQSKAVLNEKVKLDQQINKLEAQKSDILDKEKKALALLKVEQQKQNKQLRDEAVLASKSSSEYDKQTVRLNKLRKEYKDLVLQEGKATKETKALLKEITQLDGRLKAVDKSVGQGQRSVGLYENGVKSLKNTLGQLGLAFGAFSIVKNIFNTGVEFEKSMASLSAITGATGKTLDGFKASVIDVANDTKKSAIEVTKAFELVGSAKPELLANADALGEVTKQAIILSQATGDELEQSALSLTGTLNQFNLGADEASRVINVLAAGSQAGAAPVGQITEALDKFGTVANSVGVSVEQSVGLIETLAEKNIKGAEAGTKLRNVLTKLATIKGLPEKAQQSLKDYGVNLDVVSDSSISLEDRLKELGKISEDQTALLNVFGAENLVAGQILLQNTDKVKGYSDAVTGTNTAVEQAATNQDTLAAVIQQLKAAWENLVVKWTEGTGSLNVLKAVLKFVANNLEAIINLVIKSLAVWSAYKTATKAAELANKAFGKSVQGVTKYFGAASIAITALLFVIQEIVDAYQNAWDLSKDFAKAQDEVNEKVIDGKAKLQIYGKQLLATNYNTQERLDLINKINAEYGTTLKNIEDETLFMKQLANAYKEVVQEITKKAEAEVYGEKLKEATKALIEINEKIDKAGGEENLGGFFDVVGGALLSAKKDAQEAVDFYTNKLAGLEIATEATAESNIALEETIAGVGNASEKSGKQLTEEEKKLKALADFRKKQAEQLQHLESDFIALGLEREQIESELAKVRMRQFRDEGDFIIALELETTEELEKTRLAYLKFVEANNKKIAQSDIETVKKKKDTEDELTKSLTNALIEANKKIAEEEAKRKEAFKKAAQETIDIMKQVTDFIVAEYDRRIEAGNKNIEASQAEQDRLRELAAQGNQDAAKALIAESQREAREKIAVEKLEKKKRNLLITVAALERVSQLINSGDGNAFKTVGGELSEFLSSLPKLYTGTTGTLSQDLGMKQGKDSHLIWADNDEMILNPGKVSQLNRVGLTTTDDITRAALIGASTPIGHRMPRDKQMADNVMLIKAVKENTEAIKKIRIVQQHIDPITGDSVTVDGKHITINRKSDGRTRLGS